MLRVNQTTATLLQTDLAEGTIYGKASWYSTEACRYNSDRKCPTADGSSLYNLERSGEHFGACNEYALGSKIKVTNRSNGRSVVIIVRDRGGFERYGRILDLGRHSFESIADLEEGIIEVQIERLK